MSLLKVNHLVTGLASGLAIVDGISFEIAAGETFALLGESGCGKSMTALSLMRLLPDGVANLSGDVVLGEAALFDLPEREMRGIRGGSMAMIFQEPGLSLNPVMTVGAQIVEVLALHQGLSGALAQQRCVELLDGVGIPDAARRVHEYPFQLSGGMKQRVMIAMALAGKPRLLVADEPTTALDVTIQAQVLQLLRDTQAATGMAMLLITHDLGVVAETAHRVGVMYAGQIAEQASRQELFARPLHPYTQKLFAALPQAGLRDQALAAIAGSVPPMGSIVQGCRFAPRCDRAWELCREKTPEWTIVNQGQGVRCHLYNRIEEQKDRIEDRGLRFEEKTSKAAARFNAILTPQASILEVSDLHVHFPIRKGILQRVVGQVKAVDGVSLSIAKGKTLAIVGESGCGKTTLGKALLQLIPSTAGRVVFDGRERVRGQRASMQMVFQDPYASLNPKMRVAEILEEGMSALKVGGNSAARQVHIDGLLDKVGLERAAKWRYPHEFSGGQRQRIAIARALAVSPGLLICDEPTSALDVSVQAQILNLLKSLQLELDLSYLFITHNLAVVAYLAHEVCVMYLGRIVERGSTDDVLTHPAHPYTQALLSAVPRIDGAAREYIRLAGDLPSPANPPAGCHFAPRCPAVQDICRAHYPPAVNISESHVVHCHF
ncbi:ABC transporter ATP-binding protein [Gallionella capsiferriformans]|uniref:Oligopeptide/dipeptide ABC transporter, ATPase subunit n=1 Tax=Gallionella capsiferriformans (strain ES-2) TaxID=395494 RepID=D9SIQ4_GALCS|nr:ABC transporter ATP-binding protein [Gallionella capsiferriformans]ADL56217.1 oligopeptide/dipeptide ABC transporter, ATPase subunit [Gallionella capsiferriformans ES-2]